MKVLTSFPGHHGSRGLEIGILISVLPSLIWLAGTGLEGAAGSPSLIFRSLGKLAAFSGISAYALTAVLSLRHPFIHRTFGGFIPTYRAHHLFGKLGVFIIVLHPIFLSLSAWSSSNSVWAIWDVTQQVQLLGIIALLGMLLVVGVTIWSQVRHQQWIAIHRWFGWLLPLMFIHALMARSDMVQNPWLYGYIIVITGLGTVAFLLASVLHNVIFKRLRYKVVEVNRIEDSVTEIVLKPSAQAMKYIPGQFAYLTLISPLIDREPHPFSLSTYTNGPYIRFVIKELGDYTRKIKYIRPGTEAFLEGPYGNFSYTKSQNPSQVWIAGGVGITPFLSMARSLANIENYNITLFYAAQDLGDAVFLNELIEIRKLRPKALDVVAVTEKISGYITIDMIKQEVSDLSSQDYFICGPPIMMKTLRRALAQAGVEPERIFLEDFSY